MQAVKAARQAPAPSARRFGLGIGRGEAVYAPNKLHGKGFARLRDAERRRAVKPKEGSAVRRDPAQHRERPIGARGRSRKESDAFDGFENVGRVPTFTRIAAARHPGRRRGLYDARRKKGEGFARGPDFGDPPLGLSLFPSAGAKARCPVDPDFSEHARVAHR